MQIDLYEIGIRKVDGIVGGSLSFAKHTQHMQLGQPAQDALLKAIKQVGMRSVNFLQLYEHHYPACTVEEIVTVIGAWSCR